MKSTLAEVFERYVNWIVLFILLTAINQLLEAGAYLAGPEAGERLNAWALWPARAGSLAMLVATVQGVRLVRRKKQNLNRRAFLDDYVVEIVKRSAVAAFFVTLCLVAILDVAANDTELPADFYIKLPALSLTAVFSLTYFSSIFADAARSADDRSTS